MNIRKIAAPILFTTGVMMPARLGTFSTAPIRDTFVKTCTVDKLTQAADLAKTFEIKNDTNFVGGVTKTFAPENIDRLRKAIARPTEIKDYALPVKNSSNVYLEPFGMFFAKRPGGRPHLGLDIFVSKYGRKPAEPVVVTAPVDGIVISNKKANPNDNVVANCVGLLGVDGKRYAFDHLARPTDYKTSIKMPEVGKVLHKGDSIGYVGSTGETTLWHLHLTVQSQEQLAKQKSSKMWNNISKKSSYSGMHGQTDPLNENEAGLIAKNLNEYKKQNLKAANELLLPYKGRESYLKK